MDTARALWLFPLLGALVSSTSHAQTATDRAAQHLSQAIAFKTISNENATNDDQAAFSGLRAWLDTAYPKVKATLTREVISGGALLYRWQGTDSTLQPIMFLAHQDVVPVEPGTEAQWSQSAWSGVIAGGYVWGRGAVDDKGMLVSLMETAEALIRSGFTPKRTIYFGFGNDEEVGGSHGARHIADVLVQRSVHLSWVLDEGSSIITDQRDAKQLVAKIGIGQKGYATVVLVAKGQGGSSSMPPPKTAIDMLSRALVALNEHPYTTSRRMVPAFRAATETSQRTTLVPTILRAGVKDNVLPTIATATLNARIWPGDTVDMLMQYIRSRVTDRDISIQLSTGRNPSPLATTENPGYLALQSAVTKLTTTIPVTTGVISSTADARHMAQLTDAIYYFMPWILHADDLARIHGVNERLSLTQLAFGIRYFTELISGQ